MTTIDIHQVAAPMRAELPKPKGFLHDSMVIARRGLLHLKRQPEQLSDVTIQPVMFVVLFAYIFGGAIEIPGGSYREFLMGGIFAQTIGFSSFGVALGIASDRKNQAVDRFRSLPMARGSVLAGYALTNLVKAMLPVVLMSLIGLVVGWRIRSGVGDALVGYGLMLLFAFAMIWIGVLMGSLIKTPEGVQGVAFAVLFPITFIASTFVPSETMPAFMRSIANWNPITTMADSLRIQFGNPNYEVADTAPWSLQNPLIYTIIWCIGIVLVCAPIAIRSYEKSTRG
jgi:ABC-2 type transport system permease protein